MGCRRIAGVGISCRAMSVQFIASAGASPTHLGRPPTHSFVVHIESDSLIYSDCTADTRVLVATFTMYQWSCIRRVTRMRTIVKTAEGDAPGTGPTLRQPLLCHDIEKSTCAPFWINWYETGSYRHKISIIFL